MGILFYYMEFAMLLRLYKTVDGSNVINKTLTDELTIDINFKSDVDILNPSITLAPIEGVNFMEYNYAYIYGFERYFFISNIHRLTGTLFVLELAVDVLETYKEDILLSNARVRRNIKTGDYMNAPIDESVIKTVSLFESNKGLVDGESTVIFTVVSGD